MPVMIHGTGGGGTPITDATAIAEDVLDGKVFYNNDGRQTGTLVNPGLKTSSAIVTEASSYTHTDCYYYVDFNKDLMPRYYHYYFNVGSSPFYTLTVPYAMISLKIGSTTSRAIAMIRDFGGSGELALCYNAPDRPILLIRQQGKTYKFHTLKSDYAGIPALGQQITLTYI